MGMIQWENGCCIPVLLENCTVFMGSTSMPCVCRAKNSTFVAYVAMDDMRLDGENAFCALKSGHKVKAENATSELTAFMEFLDIENPKSEKGWALA